MGQDHFTEVFPIIAEVPPLGAYRMQGPRAEEAVGGRIAYKLSKALSGRWVWSDGVLLTDSPVSPVQIEIILDVLRDHDKKLFAGITGVQEDARWAINPLARAQFHLQTTVRDAEEQITQTVLAMATVTNSVRVVHEPLYRTWAVGDEPALSVSIRSHMLHVQNLHDLMLSRNEKIKNYIGWRVMDRTTTTMIGTITGTTGVLAQHCSRLLSLTKRPVMQALIEESSDTTIVFKVESRAYEYEYAATALHVLIEPDNEEQLERLALPRNFVLKSLRVPPAIRASQVKTIADLLKAQQIIGNAYNSRTHPQLFAQLEIMPNLLYGERKTRFYNPKTAGEDFVRGKLYQHHPRFKDAPLKVATINTLDIKIDDFMEALRRQLDKDFGVKMQIIKERKVRIVTPKNIESAVRLIEKEEPDMLLAFFEDLQHSEADDDHQTHYVKALTLGKGIATQTIYEKAIDAPDQIECADYVVGLHFVRETLSKGDRVTALARLYQADGVFSQYVMDTLDLDSGEPMPFVMLQTLLPSAVLGGKRVILHHLGEIPVETRKLLKKWAEVNKVDLTQVEIQSYRAPRLYGLGKTVTQPAWGSVFLLDRCNATLVTSVPPDDATAHPLLIKVTCGNVPLEHAVYSVLVWTLLHYSANGSPKMPVTVHLADQMSEWMARGGLPAQTTGTIPFWL